MNKLIVILFSFVFLFSCNPFELKPLDVKIVKNDHITARWFYTSAITSAHNHVEIQTNKGWGKVMESDGNSYKIYDVLINMDTITIQVYKKMQIYQMTNYYWGTYVRLDTTITLKQYYEKYSPQKAKYYTE